MLVPIAQFLMPVTEAVRWIIEMDHFLQHWSNVGRRPSWC